MASENCFIGMYQECLPVLILNSYIKRVLNGVIIIE